MSTYDLRPHHALCMCFFTGRGYSADFIANMDMVLRDLERGATARICAGSDALCAHCPNLQAGRCASAGKVARYDAAVMALCGLHECDIVTAAELRRAVIGNILRPGKLAAVCGDCEWSGLCQRLANDRPDFSG